MSVPISGRLAFQGSVAYRLAGNGRKHFNEITGELGVASRQQTFQDVVRSPYTYSLR